MKVLQLPGSALIRSEPPDGESNESALKEILDNGTADSPGCKIRVPVTQKLIVLSQIAFWTIHLSAAALPRALITAFERNGRFYRAHSQQGSIVIGNAGFMMTPQASRKAISLRWINSEFREIEADEPNGAYINYDVGGDPRLWKTGVPLYSRLRVPGLYPAIDLEYHFRDSSLEFDLVVKPEGKPEGILLTSDSARIEAGPNGALVLRAGDSEYRLETPYAYQMREGTTESVECRYVLDHGHIGFATGPYDRRRNLVIDPVLTTLSYLGGSGIDHIQAVGADSAGNLILAGITNSANFPGIGANTASGISIFVTKVNAAGTALMFTTVLGADTGGLPAYPQESVSSLAIDSADNIYLTGYALASNFPTTPGAWQRNSLGGFATKLTSSGEIVYSTMLGPSAWGLVAKRIRTRNNIAYLAGTVSQTEFLGTAGALQRNVSGPSDFFALSLASDGSAPLFVTALGGSGQESLSDMDLDLDGNILLAGTSGSPDFPQTPDALPLSGPVANANTAIFAQIDARGSNLLYATFLGTTSVNGLTAQADGGYTIAGASSLDPGLASLATHSLILFPVQRPHSYVAKFDASNHPVWTTDLQTITSSFGQGIRSDALGNLFWVDYYIWPSGGAVPVDGFYGVSKLSADGSRLLYVSPVSGTYATGVPFGDGQFVFGGWTSAGNLPTTPGAIQPNRDLGVPGTQTAPLNYDDGIFGVLDLSSFKTGNFFAAAPQQGITWRIGQPLPQAISIPVVVSGDPGQLTVSATGRLTASYTSTSSPNVMVNANYSQTQSGNFQEQVTITSTNPNSSLSIPVSLNVQPPVDFQLASNQVQIQVRHGQSQSTVATVGMTADLGGGYFSFNVSSDSHWVYGNVHAVDATHYSLSITVVDSEPGAYDGVLTISLGGLQNPQRTVAVHYVVDPPATISLSSNVVRLHVVKGQPVVPTEVTVIGSVPGVSWNTFIGVSRTWLQVSQTSKTTPGAIVVTVDPARVEVGYWGFNLSVSGEAGQQIGVNILVDVSSGAPLDTVPSAIDYSFMRGGPYLQTAQILSFTAPTATPVQWSTDQPWITPRQGSGVTPFSIYVSFDSSLAEGVYTATLTARAGASRQAVPITWRLSYVPHLVFPTDPINFRWQIGDPAPAKQISITCPTMTRENFSAGSTNYPSFLKLDPAYGQTPATLNVMVNTAGLMPGTYKTNLAISGSYPDSQNYPWIPVTLEVLPNPNAPAATLSQAADAASYLRGSVSPGEILVIFGAGLGPNDLVHSQPGTDGRFPTSLANGTFYFDEIPAPALYSSVKQSSVVVPFGIAGRSTTKLVYENGGKRTEPLKLTVNNSNPGIFTADSSGSGQAAALNVADDGSATTNTTSMPAARGSIVTIFATGLGTTSPVLRDGSLGGTPPTQLVAPISVLIGGVSAQVLYAGPAPGLIAGLMQLNVRVPSSVQSGLDPIFVIAAENPSQPGVSIAVQ